MPQSPAEPKLARATKPAFVPLAHEPDLVYKDGEVPCQCARCDVELVNLNRPLCLACYQDWKRGKR